MLIVLKKRNEQRGNQISDRIKGWMSNIGLTLLSIFILMSILHVFQQLLLYLRAQTLLKYMQLVQQHLHSSLSLNSQHKQILKLLQLLFKTSSRNFVNSTTTQFNIIFPYIFSIGLSLHVLSYIRLLHKSPSPKPIFQNLLSTIFINPTVSQRAFINI